LVTLFDVLSSCSAAVVDDCERTTDDVRGTNAAGAWNPSTMAEAATRLYTAAAEILMVSGSLSFVTQKNPGLLMTSRP